jgi:hypothetical protein
MKTPGSLGCRDFLLTTQDGAVYRPLLFVLTLLHQPDIEFHRFSYGFHTVPFIVSVNGGPFFRRHIHG